MNEEKGLTNAEGSVDRFPWMIVIRVFSDGDQICALSGANLQEGVAGFGRTVVGALAAFISSYEEGIEKRLEEVTGAVLGSPRIRPGYVLPEGIELIPLCGLARRIVSQRAGERAVHKALPEAEVKRLADFILKQYPDEIGAGDPVHGESAVDIAIRLLSSRF